MNRSTCVYSVFARGITSKTSSFAARDSRVINSLDIRISCVDQQEADASFRRRRLAIYYLELASVWNNNNNNDDDGIEAGCRCCSAKCPFICLSLCASQRYVASREAKMCRSQQRLSSGVHLCGAYRTGEGLFLAGEKKRSLIIITMGKAR